MYENTRTSPMKVGNGAYLAMAKLYREKAAEVRERYLTQEQKNQVARMLEDAAKDYEATAAEMVKS
jgi:hypothetical protein